MCGRRPDPSFLSPGIPGDALLGVGGGGGAVLSKYCKQLSRVSRCFLPLMCSVKSVWQVLWLGFVDWKAGRGN